MNGAWKKRAIVVTALLGLVGGLSFAARSAGVNADSVYYGGKIYTMTDLLNAGTGDFSKLKEASPANARTVEVVAAKDGKIVFAGRRADAEAQGYWDAARKVDLQGHIMLPGLVDGHGHFPGQGTTDLYNVDLNSPPLGKMNSIADYKEAISLQCGMAAGGDGVMGVGYDDSLIPELIAEARHPTRKELDEACADKGVIIKHISGHIAVANTKALIDGGVLDATGNALGQNAYNTPGNSGSGIVEGLVLGSDNLPTGLLLETKAMNLVNVSVTTDAQKGLARASQVYAAAGVTTADDGATMLAGQLGTYQKGLDKKNLSLRVLVHPIAYYYVGGTDYGAKNREALGWTGGADKLDGSNAVPIGADITGMTVQVAPPAGLPPDRVMQGAHKLLYDGSPQGYTAWFKSPGHYDWGGYTAADSSIIAPATSNFFVGAGSLNVPTDKLNDILAAYQQYGISTETHTNGSAAAEYWVAALEKAVAAHPGAEDTRHTSIHAQTVELQLLQRLNGDYDAAEAAILGMGSAADYAAATEADTYGKMYTDLAGAFKGAAYNKAEVGNKEKGELAAAMRKQNFLMSYYINHTYFWGDRHKEIFMGPGRANNMSPVGWSIALGMPYSFHNDTTVTPISPLRSIQSGVTRTTAVSAIYPGGTLISGEGHDLNAVITLPSRKIGGAPDPASNMKYWNYDHRINAVQAMLAVTYMPAWQNKVEDRIGSIQPGLYADFTILDLDPAQVAEKAPRSLADIRVTTTIVSDEPVHGFLPGSESFATVPKAAYFQADGVTVENVAGAALSNAEADRAHALQRGETRYGAHEVEADVSSSGDVAVLQMDMLGNDSPASAFTLYSIAVPTRPEKFAYAQDRDMSAGGNFWIAPMDDPKSALAPGDVLAMNKSYVLFYTMEDGGKFDEVHTRAAAADGKVTGRVSLVTTGSLPTNRTAGEDVPSGGGGDSGGCTIGATPSYDLAILLLAVIAVAALRLLRRRVR